MFKVILLSTLIISSIFAQSSDPLAKYGNVDPSSLSASQIAEIKQSMEQKNAQTKYAGTNVVKDLAAQTSQQSVSAPASAESQTTDKKTPTHTLNKGSITYFGYSIFKTIPAAFEPAQIGPVDPGYLLGPGDVLRLAVWGEVEFQYEMSVSNEGKIYIPVLGQVFVTGMSFDDIQLKIKNLLSRHYSGIAKNPPTIFMDLTVAKLRPLKIFVMGELEFPGGYTVSSYATVFNALYSIGGPLPSGSLREITVFRNGKPLSSIDIYEYLLKGSAANDVRLQNNDIIFIPPRKKSVTITGNILKPAIYELKDDENLKILLQYAGNINTDANIDRAQILRIKPFAERKAFESDYILLDLDLKNMMQAEKDFNLCDQDNITIFSLFPDMGNFVTLTGKVKNPGMYEIKDLTLYSLIFTYGKLIEEATTYTLRGDIIRKNSDHFSSTIIPFSLSTLKNDSSYMSELRPQDNILIYSISVSEDTSKFIIIAGEVQNPGTYIFSENMNIGDLIIQAGGFTEKAYRSEAEIARIKENNTNYENLLDSITIQLPEKNDLYTKEKTDKYLLKNKDVVYIRSDYRLSGGDHVIITGQVSFPGTYSLVNRNERISDLLARCDGFLSDAFPEGSVLIRKGKRLVINFQKILDDPTSSDNVCLRNGDALHIPTKPNTVVISGNINVPGLYAYIPGRRVINYINNGGGYRDSTAYTVLTYPSGRSNKIKRHGFSRLKRVKEGSEIIVMRKVPRPVDNNPNRKNVSDVIKDVLAIVVSAVTVIVLAVSLKK